MYAIIATGGKQYKVAEGDVIKVEKLGAGLLEKQLLLTRFLLLTTERCRSDAQPLTELQFPQP